MNFKSNPNFLFLAVTQPKQAFIVLMLIVVSATGHAQEASISDFKSAINNAKTDSLKIAGHITLSHAYMDENLLDSSLWAAKIAKQMAGASKFELLEGWADFMIGCYYYYEGSYDEGIRLESEVAEKAKKMNAYVLQANANKMIAWMYTEMGRQNEALALFKSGLPIFKKSYKEDLHMNIGISYYGIATAYYYLAHYDSARLYYDSAITAKPPMDPREMALALSDRAAVLGKHLNDPKGALADAIRSVQILEHTSSQRDAFAYVQAELARTYARMNEFDKARHWAQKAFDLYGEVPLAKRYVSVYKTLSEAFRLSGDFEHAYEAEIQTRILQDSIYEWRKLRVIEDIKAKYETDKKNQEILNLNVERIHQESVLIKNQTAFGIVLFLLVIMGGLGVLYYRKREKYHKKIRGLEGAQQVRVEKERIAKELHDSLGSRLSTISLGLQRAAHETGNESLSVINDLTDKAMNELRDSIWAMNKDFISLEELEQRINTLFWNYRKMNHPMELEMKMTGMIGAHQLSPDAGAHLYRIIQEAVQNSIKHSGATRLEVSILKGQGFVKVSITDNGKGFQLPREKSQDHFGLSNMQRRAEMIGATYHLKTTPGEGTVISIKLAD